MTHGVKAISRRAHGIADYSIVVVLLSLPTALGFGGVPRALAYALSFGHLLITALSPFAPGAIPVLPFRVHGNVEAVVGTFLIFSPWALRFSTMTAARNSFVLIGAALLVLALFTKFDRRLPPVPRVPGDRRRRFAKRR
ncbi:MAG: SPW repeat protein [Gemmatimonadota bacterium]|nr:SPW repeat protein [Gemmatimonadota bacterium]